MKQKVGRGLWDLGLEVTGMLREPGCGWNYEPGFQTLWDGRHYPTGMCPFAWNAFSPWIWALRYGCPVAEHPVVFRIRPIEGSNRVQCGA